ncbi:MAG: hypothetical protein COU27_00255 [Candidatus Levybacteria bacterium CG10_big_fil_rev_8_21_14_0_10_36_7]|nr:MAG: hypothetical protein COU27_00255 [Candidatus Levybacteria bacterium CG10_big_fil_rev_8_21_14_0_10_36_7]
MLGGAKKTKSRRKKVDNKENETVKKSKKVELKVRVKNQPKKEAEPKIEEAKEEVAPIEKPVKKKVKAKKENTKKEILSSPKEEKGRIIYENTEKDRRLIMWTGVIFFMVLIGAGWIYNAKKVFVETKLEGNEKSTLSFDNWEKMTGELSEKIVQMKEDLASLKEFEGEDGGLMNTTNSERDLFATSSEEFLATTTEESLATTTEENETKIQLDKLREKLEALEKGLESE